MGFIGFFITFNPKIMTKLLDVFFNSKITKIIISYSILVFGFFIYKNHVNIFIKKYLTVDRQFLEQINITFFIIIISILVIYGIYKFQLKKYQPSNNSLHILFLSILFLGIIRFTNYSNGWEFILIRPPFMYFIDLLGLPLIISAFILLKNLF